MTFVVCAALSIGGRTADAAMLTVGSLANPFDEILFPSTLDTGSTGLAGLAVFEYDSTSAPGVLKITLTNKSASTVDDDEPSDRMLTGIGFSLPGTYLISGGSVVIASGSSASGFSGTNVSQEWGYENGSPIATSSHLIPPKSTYRYNNSVSSHGNDAPVRFDSSGSLGAPPGLGGPDFGLWSADYSGTSGGQESVVDSVVISLSLTGTFSGSDDEFLAALTSKPVAILFGSPDGNVTHAVPEPGSLTLLVTGALGACAVARRRRQAAA